MEPSLAEQLRDLAGKARIVGLQLEAARKQPKPEHQRLVGVLREIATGLGCTSAFDLSQLTSRKFDPEPNPDVEVCNDAGQIFVGDTKDSANELASHAASRTRIFGYMQALGQVLNSGMAHGGFFVLATNDAVAAAQWAGLLNLAAIFCRIGHVGVDKPNFTVRQIDSSTWIIL